MALAFFRRLTDKHQNAFHDVPAEEHPEVSFGQLEQFSLRELQVATNDFGHKSRLSRDVFVRVYKCQLADGTHVSVKRLLGECSQGKEKSFRNEIEINNMPFHRNLLRLRGFCITKTERILVYPYMEHGSLGTCLRERGVNKPPLDWSIRKRIAVGSARGLAYLHDHCDAKVIHRDVKAANILLDEEFEPFISNFELAKRVDHKETHVTSTVRGTLGHLPPEYLTTGELSVKTDVFGYGVMLLELISGQRAFDLPRLANDEDVVLLDWVKGLLMDNKLEILVDTNLQGNYDTDEVMQMIQVALLCTQCSPKDRPKMSHVVILLDG